MYLWGTLREYQVIIPRILVLVTLTTIAWALLRNHSSIPRNYTDMEVPGTTQN